MRSAQVTFDLRDEKAERELLETYLVDAWDRFQTHEGYDRGWFWRFGATGDYGEVELEDGTVVEDGGVILVLTGDPEPILDEERLRWQDLEASGLVEDRETKWFDPVYENARGQVCRELRPGWGR